MFCIECGHQLLPFFFDGEVGCEIVDCKCCGVPPEAPTDEYEPDGYENSDREYEEQRDDALLFA